MAAESGQVKHCRKCDRTLPASEFNRDAGRPDGLYYHCRECQKFTHYRVASPHWKRPALARVEK